MLLVLCLVGVSVALDRNSAAGPTYSVKRAAGPDRSIVRSATGAWVATFTDGARTVALAGPRRTFSQASAAHPVKSSTWVRVLPAPFRGRVDFAWLDRARADRSPDVLATAFEFVSGSPDRRDARGRLIAGDASYGPLRPDGTRAEGADWNDFQGVTAMYDGVPDRPEPDQKRSLDCSGYMRMLWGVRFGIPLTRAPDGHSLPRRAVQQAASGPGIVPIANTGRQVTNFERLQVGDLVFFDASDDDGDDIDHVGMYLGPDTAGHKRFISSRKSADGPTMGDYRGRSVLDGTGLYASSFRSTRRL